MMKQITVLIPMYNEAKRIPPTLKEIEYFIGEHPGRISEVLCVDDGCKDNTVEEVLRFSQRLSVRVLSLPQNSGKWAAVHHGLENVKTDTVLLLDADGSASIFELEKVDELDEVIKRKIAIFGSRALPGSEVEGKSLMRSIISWGYRVFVKFWYWYGSGKTDVDDMQCPWKLVHRSMMYDLFFVERWAGDIELACNIDGRIENLPIRFVHKRGSKVPVTAIFSMAWETMQVAIRIRKQLKAGALKYDTRAQQNI